MTSELQKEHWRIQKQLLRQTQKDLLSIFPCKLCGESDVDLIDWHHVNPDEKSANVTDSLPHNAWWNEVLKCIPVCVSCHRKIHKDKLCLLPIQR